MTTTFFLVRHASHEQIGRILVGRTDAAGLSAHGEQEAERLAERLSRERVAALYSSPRRRARQTAEAVGRGRGLDVATAGALDEIDFGDWTNRPFAELEGDPAWRDWNRRRSQGHAPGGEAMAAVQRRVVAFFESCRARHPGEAVAAFGHCDPFRALLLHHLGLPLDAIERIEVAPGSLTTLVLGDWGARLILLNEMPE